MSPYPRLIALTCAAFLCALPVTGPLWAQSAGGAMSDEVRIGLRGHVVPRCDLTGAPSSLDLGSLPEAGAQGQGQLQFQLSCNTPFAYQLSSGYGAMRHKSGAAGGGFAADFPYRAMLTILTDSGSDLTLDCASAQLGDTAGSCIDTSGDETAIDKQASLTVSWGPLPGLLAAGEYADDLRVSFSIGN